MKADPRFAAWEAAAPAATPVCKGLPLGPSLEDLPPSPAALRVLEERRELMRIAAVSALANGGKHLDAQQLREVKARAAVAPLNRPLGDGEPT